ncbi:MAG: carboxypeptidase-like regulatory domain-containing protein [Aristaeellaceae bacterium]
MTAMRKLILFFAAMLCMLLLTTACAETVTLDTIYATVDIPDAYILLTPDNLDLHPEWIARMGETKETLLADWTERGVLIQAWNSEGDVCLEITAVQDEDALQYFDVDVQTTQMRSTYRVSHLKNTRGDGWTYQTAEWKKTNQYGRFLMLKYKRVLNGETIRGYARRTIRNGYTITVDLQVFGRSLKTVDSTAINNVMKSWHFTQTLTKPADVASKLQFTSKPPAETNTGSFTVKGTCDPGLHIIGVAMRMSSPDPIIFETTASKKGAFSMPVQLPSEGVWLMTLTVENGDVVTEEVVFDTTTYQKSLLPVNLDEGSGLSLTDTTSVAALTSAKTVVSGKTIKGVTVQCIVDGAGQYSKQVTTNNSGKFSFTVDTSAEGDYEFTLVFSKKGMSTRRFVLNAKRTITEAERRQIIREAAVKPAYSTLTQKLKGYTGRYMVYTLYATEIIPSGDEWIIFMAMTKTKTSYKNIVVVIADEEPPFQVGDQQKLYAQCIGSYDVSSEEKTTSYPCFQLCFWE